MMNNADIVIFNRFLSADRREIFIPTTICGVSWHSVHSSYLGDGNKESGSRAVVRIPYRAKVQDGKTFVREDVFKKLSLEQMKKHWTIQKNSYVMLLMDADMFSELEDLKEVGPAEINKLSNEYEDFFAITEYADNTRRGSDRVKHWRIGSY